MKSNMNLMTSKIPEQIMKVFYFYIAETCGAYDHDFRRKWQKKKSTEAQTMGPIQQLIISASNPMFGKGIRGKKFPRGGFESKEDVSSVEYGVSVGHLAGRHLHGADRS